MPHHRGGVLQSSCAHMLMGSAMPLFFLLLGVPTHGASSTSALPGCPAAGSGCISGSMPSPQKDCLESHGQINRTGTCARSAAALSIAGLLLGLVCMAERQAPHSSPAARMTTGWRGRSPRPVGVASIFFTTSKPSSTVPNTTCRPSSQGVGTVVMKNCGAGRRGVGLVYQVSCCVRSKRHVALCHTAGQHNSSLW